MALSDNEGVDRPRWLRDLLRFLPLKSQFVLSGNVRDLQISYGPSGATPQPLIQYLATELRSYGYQAVISFDPVNGFRVVRQPGETPEVSQALLNELSIQEGGATTRSLCRGARANCRPAVRSGGFDS